MELGPPEGQVDTLVEPINTRGLRTRVLRELSRPGFGHETGSARSMSCMPNARKPHAQRPDRASLTDGAKIKADERPEDLRKLTPSKCLEILITSGRWKWIVKLLGNVNTSTLIATFIKHAEQHKETEFIRKGVVRRVERNNYVRRNCWIARGFTWVSVSELAALRVILELGCGSRGAAAPMIRAHSAFANGELTLSPQCT
jgi:hypothetical protein